MRAYIDLGACRGEYIEKFQQSSLYTPDTKIYAFECCPELSGVSYGADVVHIKKAVWIDDGYVKFYTSDNVEAGTTNPRKTTGDISDKPTYVPCIDFSAWLKRTFVPDDYVVVKCNIEGAEYPVFEKCIKDGTIHIISQLHIRWHWNKIGMNESRHLALLNSLRAIDFDKMVYTKDKYGDFK